MRQGSACYLSPIQLSDESSSSVSDTNPRHRRHSLPKAPLDELSESYRTLRHSLQLMEIQREQGKEDLRRQILQRLNSRKLNPGPFIDSVGSTSDELSQSNREAIVALLGMFGGPLQSAALKAIIRSKGQRFVLLINNSSALGLYIPSVGCLKLLVGLKGSPLWIKGEQIKQRYRLDGNGLKHVTHFLQSEDAITAY